jgi:putative transposase
MNFELAEMYGECGYVHLLINYPPKLAVSNLSNSLKGVSSRLLRRDRPALLLQRRSVALLLFASGWRGAPNSIIQRSSTTDSFILPH